MELKPGEKRVLESGAALESLIIAEDAEITAPEGRLITLVVDGVEMPIKPGRYENAVLEVTESYMTPVEDFDTPEFRSALFVDNGIVKERSVLSAVTGGSYNDSGLSGASIKSESDMFSGVIVAGGKYEIKDMSVEMKGCGGNDFSGKGTSVVVAGDAEVDIDGLKVSNRGLIRNAVVVGGQGKLTVKNADITACGVPEEEAKPPEGVFGMFGCPWVLGITGNNRATNVVGKGTVTYIDSTIRAEGWGVLSTDGVDAPDNHGDFMVNLTAQNCGVEIFGDSGYGSYSIGACNNVFDNCRFKVPDYALIAANEYAGGSFQGGTAVESGRFGVMWHQNQGGVLNIRDSEFNTGMTVLLIKACYPEIRVENSVLNAKNGVILQLMDSDDPGLMAVEIETDKAVAVKDSEHDVTGLNYHDVIMFGKPINGICTDARASFKDMSLVGDFYNSMTNAAKVGMAMSETHPDGPPPEMPAGGPGGDMPPMPEPDPSSFCPINLVLSFENTEITGVISSSSARHSVPLITKENRRELGQVSNTPSRTVNNGVIVSLDKASRWIVTGTSYLTSLTLEDGAVIAAPEGKNLLMSVNGADTVIAPGSFSGDIVISVI